MVTRQCGSWAAAALILAATSAGLSSAPSAQGERPSRVSLGSHAAPGEIIVGFKPRVSALETAKALGRAGAATKVRFRQIGAVLATVPAGDVRAALANLRSNGRVRYAEPNSLLFAENHDGSPNDSRFHELWGLRNFGQTVNGFPGTAGADIRAVEAWDVTTGDSGVTVGIIDTGVDWSHPDLAANIWLNPGETCSGCANDNVDNDGNGYVDDVRGWDFLNDDKDPFDDHGHGTHVAGTVGAVGNNGAGVVGVNWAVKLMPLKFLGADGSGTTADAIRAVLYAADNGAAVTNNSYGGDGFSQAFADAIAYADERGSLFVAAAGNSLSNNDASPHYPSSYSLANVMSVAATDSSDRKAWFSNYGRASVDLGAPGDNIYSTWPGNSYEYASGTSMASPHVAGAAALVKAAFPAASDVGIKALLLDTVDPTTSLDGQTATGGRLDVGAAVHCVATPEVWLDSPAPGFVAALGQPLPIRAIVAACADPTGVSVTATGNGEPIPLAARGDGVYTGTYSPGAEGPFTISISASFGGATETRTVSEIVPQTIVPGGDPVTVTAANPGDDALLGFLGTAGQRVSVKLTGVTIGTSSCCSTRVSITNPDGTTLVVPTYVGTNGTFVDAKTLPGTGTYTILVDPQGTSTGSATLTLYDVPPDTSAAITPGGPAVTVATSVPGQNARLTFAGTAGQRVSLKIGPLCCTARISLLRPDGAALVSSTYVSTSGGFIDTRTLPIGGTYTIAVNLDAAATGSATLTLYDVPPDASAAITPGGPAVTVATSVPGQNARLTFAGTAGQSITLKLSSVTIPLSRVSIAKPDGSNLVGPTFVSTSGRTFTAQLPVDGAYTVVVDPEAANVGSLTSTLS